MDSVDHILVSWATQYIEFYKLFVVLFIDSLLYAICNSNIFFQLCWDVIDKNCIWDVQCEDLIYIYFTKEFPHIEFIKTSITSSIYLFFIVRTLKCYSIGYFHLYKVLWNKVTMLYFSTSDLIYLITENLCPFTSLSFFP